MPGGGDGLVVVVEGLLAQIGDLVAEPVALEVGAVLQIDSWRKSSGSSALRVSDHDLAPNDIALAAPGSQIWNQRSARNGWTCQSMKQTSATASGTHLGADRPRAILVLAFVGIGGTDQDRDLAQVLVLAQQLVRLAYAVEAHRLPQHRPDLALGHQLVGAHALVGVGEVGADDLLLAHPQVAHVEVQRVAGRGAADDDLAEGLDHEDRGGKSRFSHMLEDDVGGVAEDLLDSLGEAARDLEALLLLFGRLFAGAHHPRELVAVDVADGSELFDQRALLVGGDDAHGVGPGGCAELRREHAEAAGGAPDQDVVARLQLALVHQHPEGGEVGEPVGRRLGPAQVLGAGEELLSLHLGELGEGAPGGLVARNHLAGRRQRVKAVDLDVLVGGLVAVEDDLVAGLPLGDALADLPDDPRGIGTADVVTVLLMVAVAEDGDRLAERRPDVVEVDPGRHHPDDHLEGAGLGGPRSPRPGRRRWARPRARDGSPRRPSSPAACRAPRRAWKRP